ncbi:MAG TPA: hypothetical protein VJ249_03760 [Candidatus Bathyarchaeia archaeon]|nr:hypothetical protein [Candidatus Bathyarchaeia archaeon]
MKPKNIAALFAVSLSRKTGSVSRELWPVRLMPGIKGDVRIEPKNGARGTRKHQDGLKARTKVIYVQDRKAGLNAIMKSALTHYGQTSRLVLGAQLIVEGKTVQTWLQPWTSDFVKNFSALEKTTAQLSMLRNNGGSRSQLAFFEKLQGMYDVDLSMKTAVKTRATYAMMHDEFKNFARGFDVWL